MTKHLKILTFTSILFISLFLFGGCTKTSIEKPWNEKYDFIYEMQPVKFHYDHGILAGSYPENQETVEIRFNDVCKYLGHVCLCGAGGYKISEKAVNLLTEPGKSLERGDFVLISGRDHTVSDVISYVLGCSKRNDLKNNQYFIDSNITAPKREYHYYIGYPPNQKAVHVIYRKHLLIGNELMDSLWKVELAYEENPASVNQADFELYQKTMFEMVQDVLLDKKEGLFEIKLINYNEFQSVLNKLKPE